MTAAGRRATDPLPPPVVGDWPPTAGFYRGRMVRGGPWLAIRIWFGPPLDPDTGEECDRAKRWQATRGGAEADPRQLWPYVANHPIAEAEFNYMSALRAHAVKHEPDMPEAAPTSPVDLNRLKPIF